MRLTPQEKFRRDVKTWLTHRRMSVTALARKVGRRRDTVSIAINQYRFPRVRAKIEEVIR
jgi:IS30 family transposase